MFKAFVNFLDDPLFPPQDSQSKSATTTAAKPSSQSLSPSATSALKALYETERSLISTACNDNCKKLSVTSSQSPTATNEISQSQTTKSNDNTMNLCCDSLYATILPNKCKACSLLQKPKPKLKSKPTQQPTLTTAEIKLYSDFCVNNLEVLLLHGLKCSLNPVQSTSQAVLSCIGIIELIEILAGENNGKTVSALDRNAYNDYVKTLQIVLGQLKLLTWYEKGAGFELLTARSLVRLLLAEENGLHAYTRLLLHSSNKQHLQQYYNASSIWRQNPSTNINLQSACSVVKKLSVSHVYLISDLENVEVVEKLRRKPSQWWPLNFEVYKARDRYTVDFNYADVENAVHIPPASGNISNDVIIDSFEEGMDEFIGVLDKGFANLLNLYDGVDTNKAQGHTSIKRQSNRVEVKE